jgi:NMD protein affecting ribosome stability and mRNA decay
MRFYIKEGETVEKGRFGRQDRLIKEKQNDVYVDRQKYSEPTLCIKCNALYINGRWTWQHAGQEVSRAVCPACKRIADNYPAGTIEISGVFYEHHQDEMMNLIMNVEKQEKTQHVLERIMRATRQGNKTVVTTTGIHLARRIGEALARSYKGDLSFQYLDADKGIRVTWER